MHLRTKFSLTILVAVTAVTFAGLGLFGKRESSIVQEGLRQQMSLALTVGEASRTSAGGSVAPIVRRMKAGSPSEATAGSAAFAQISRQHPEFEFRDVALNPLNKANTPTPFETRIIGQFRSNSVLQQVSGLHGTVDHEEFYVARPVVAKRSCLSCHGSPRSAPEYITTGYGRSHGYHWKPGEVVGALIVSTPSNNASTATAGLVTAAIWPVGGLILSIGATAFLAFYFLVERRIGRLSYVMARAAQSNNFGVRINDTGRDELGEVMRNFDEMMGKIRAAQSSLESQVQKRTEALQRSAAELGAVFEATGEGIITTDEKGTILMINAEVEHIWGYTREWLIGRDMGLLMGGDFEIGPGEWLPHYLKKRGDETGQRTEGMGCRKDGTQFPLEMSISEVRKGDGKLYTACVRDITDRRQAESRLRLLSSVAQESMSGIIITDFGEKIVYVNPAFEKMSGYALEEIQGKKPDKLLYGPATSYEALRTLRDCMDGRKAAAVEMVNYHRDGTPYWIEMHIAPVFDEQGRCTHFVAVENDITERKRLEAEREKLLVDAQRRAETDALTDLYNHRAMQDRLQQAMDNARMANEPLAVAMLDVSDFKLFNDVYGHIVGDRVLRLVADALRFESNSGDVVCRYGGDEFLALMPNTSADEAENRLRKLQEYVNGRDFVPKEGERAIPIRLAWGVAVYPEDATGRLELLARADAQMYQFKRRGQAPLRIRRPESVITDSEAMDTLVSLVNAVDNKDRYTRRHSEEVAEYASLLARALGMSVEEQHVIWAAGMVHDVGKIGVADSVLRKPGKLEPEEWEAMKQHPVIGKRLVEAFTGLLPTLDGVLYHHEKWDGSGYPCGLAGEDIPFMGRLMAVADVYSALTTARPYRYGMDPEQAFAVLERDAGTHFDPRLVPVFCKVMREALRDEWRLAA